jgi:hypothetical protein
MSMRSAVVLALAAAATAASCSTPVSSASTSIEAAPAPGQILVERITTKPPFPRGLQLVDGQLYVLCRGRVRDYGGVSAAVNDQAGTLYAVDPDVAEVYSGAQEPGTAIRENGTVLALPSEPAFKLWDRTADPPWSDREADRPYCGLTWHAPTQSFYICAFSGIDRDEKTGKTFSKNLSDAILRYDRRTSKWYEVERHDIDKGGIYPHHDPRIGKLPHGWLNGPDNCLAVGNSLYAVSKDNSLLVRYDLTKLAADPEAGPPPSEFVFGADIDVAREGRMRIEGHSALACHDGWLYVATRTSGHVVRLKLDEQLLPAVPQRIELIARFDPFDPATRKSGNVSDMCVGPDGSIYCISMQPSRCFRFTPDPRRVFDARGGAEQPYVDLAALTGNPKMKSENLLVDSEGRIYITSGDAYSYHEGAGGVVWRVTVDDGQG